MGLEQFKAELSKRIADAKKHGISDRALSEGMVSLADIMMNFDKPATEEEALVKEMWNVANQNEKKMLVGLVMRLAGDEGKMT